MTVVADWRQFFAEEIQAVANLRSDALVAALAAVPREQYLPPGPWLIRGESDTNSQPRRTSDADPRRVHHNLAVAIDPVRMLFNGAPGVLASWIDALGLQSGAHVLHVGCGLGYYTALMGHCVGSNGRILAIEVDALLAAEARDRLASLPSVEVRNDDGTRVDGEMFDAILVNAGVTHPLEVWLTALNPGGRLILPLTCTFPQMGPLGKGIVVLISRSDTVADSSDFDLRLLGIVAIYSAVGIRDPQLNDQLGKSLMRLPFPAITRLRRDQHDSSPSCWLHGDRFCFSAQ